MCKTLAEGGARCATRTRQDAVRATEALVAAETAERAARVVLNTNSHGTPGHEDARTAFFAARTEADQARSADRNAKIDHAMTRTGRAEAEAVRQAAMEDGDMNGVGRAQALLLTADDKKRFLAEAREAAQTRAAVLPHDEAESARLDNDHAPTLPPGITSDYDADSCGNCGTPAARYGPRGPSFVHYAPPTATA